MMRKDLRAREALRVCTALAEFGHLDAFDDVAIADLRKLAELIETAGGLAGVTIELAAAFGGTSRHRLQVSRRALSVLVGDEHPATRAVAAALTILQHGRRKGTHHRDNRTRDAVLHGQHWAAFRNLPGASTTSLDGLRAVDRYLSFCSEQGMPGGEVASFLAFVGDKDSSMLLRTLRDGLEGLLTAAHPAVTAAEEARSLKEGERSRRRKPLAPAAPPPLRPLDFSVPEADLPVAWRDAVGRRAAARGKKNKGLSAERTLYAARQLLWAARQVRLPDELSLPTLQAYDAALETRGVAATSRTILFRSILHLGGLIGAERELLDDLEELVGHYLREAGGTVKRKESKLAVMPSFAAIFDKANELLDSAAAMTDRRRKLTLYVDAAALAFLSFIPLRNQDTMLQWGRHVSWIADEDPAELGLEEHPERLGYYIDLRTNKTGEGLHGPLAPILTPFLDGLILQGRDDRLLPQLRQRAMAAQAPVFPKTMGRPRTARSLSDRWRANIGVGSGISRTRIHTLLGAMGERGVRAALALCAQRSPRTAKWYQAQALAGRLMSDSQEMTVGLVELTDDEREDLLAGL
jgi:hypothetical protein